MRKFGAQIGGMKFKLTRTAILLVVFNEIRGFVMIAPALFAALKAHHLL